MNSHELDVCERAYRRGVHQAFAAFNDYSRKLRDDQLRTALGAAEDAACDIRHSPLDERCGMMDDVIERVKINMADPWNV